MILKVSDPVFCEAKRHHARKMRATAGLSESEVAAWSEAANAWHVAMRVARRLEKMEAEPTDYQDRDLLLTDPGEPS